MDISVLRQWLITVSFIVGAFGNSAALWILQKSAKTRNSKHVLMLRCLAVNDLVAQVGMLTLMILSKYMLISVYWKCALYVMLRAFGLGSGCVALVMAVERWMALTKPFSYQQHMTQQVIKMSIFILWTLAVIISYLPLAGFGLYYKNGKCHRYREATEICDKIYAYMFMIFGTGLCVCIAWCNTKVFCALSQVGKKHKKVLIRRISRAVLTQNRINSSNFATNEELAFAKLMAFICFVFLLCWMPQMILIPLGQFASKSTFYIIFSRISDLLMCVYFTLDPYIYVIHQYIEKRKFRLTFKRTTSAIIETPNNTPNSDLLNGNQPFNFELQTENV